MIALSCEREPTLRGCDIDWTRIDVASLDWTGIDWVSGWDTRPVGTGADDARARRRIPVTLYGISEAVPGQRWQALFESTWPAYRRWYLKEGNSSRPDLRTAQAMLTRHMPELVPTYERLVELTDGDEVAARMLTLWDPPAFLPSCSQAVLPGRDPVLCRNYDYDPDLWERTVCTTAFTGRRVIGTGDCLWGLLDGMNDAGLVVSLAFGGRLGSAPGFAIPLVVRYLLEVAETVAQARVVLADLPVAMSYNLTMADASSDAGTVFVAPGMAPEFRSARAATNHRGEVPEYPARDDALHSRERLHALESTLASSPDASALVGSFLRDPLYNDDYTRGFGTLYTALYRPADGTVEYLWPDGRWRRGFDDPSDEFSIVLAGR